MFEEIEKHEAGKVLHATHMLMLMLWPFCKLPHNTCTMKQT